MKKIILSIILVIMFTIIYFSNINVLADHDNIEVNFNDTNLYKAIVNELNQEYTYAKDDNAKCISIPSTEIQKIKRLELDGKDIHDIAGIDKFASLEELIINNNQISSINVLYTLKGLTYLDLSHNCITNINGINVLTELKHLDLYDNIIRDLNGLENMSNLEYLNLGDNNEVNTSEITNIQKLSTLPNLTYFNFSRNNTPEIINYVNSMLNIVSLNIQGNNISNIVNLSNLTNIKELYLNSNSITDISSLASLVNMEVLYLNNNSIQSLEGIFENNELIFTKLKKLHIYNLKNINKNSNEIAYLKGLSKAKSIELGYEIIYDNVEPHTDSNGINYITYDDFGARCDGIYDDMISIKDAHRYANSKGYEVKATEGKTYHIFNFYSGTAAINTNTDWQNATFIIHDEDIEDCSGRFDNIFTVTSNYSGITTIQNPEIEVKKDVKKITGIEDILSNLNSRGYKKYMLMVENANKKISIRYGTTSKDNQIDCFEIDSEGNVLNDIQWDFETVTKLTIYPISDKKLTIQNGNFITNVFNGVHDVPYGRGYGKQLYYNRGMFFWAASNVDLTNINHTLSEDRLSGSYFGFLVFRFCSDINVKDSTIFAREFGTKSRSTYDLKIEQCVNFYFENVISNGFYDANRWGVMATAYCKDFEFNNVKLNRIDAHQVIYNLTVRDSYLGYRGFTLTGQGTLIVENTTVEAEYFINLRSDYGSTWNGDIYIINCTHKHQSQYMHKFINFSVCLDGDKLHDFGYELHQPNIYMYNFTVDCVNKRDIKSYPIIANFSDHNFERAEDDYWPDNIYINGYKIINNDNSAPYISLFYTNIEGIDNNYIITDTKLKVGNSDYTDKFDSEESFKTDKDVTLEIAKNISANNIVTIYKNDDIVLDSKEIDDDFSQMFTQNGKYKIIINSVDTHFNKTGEKQYEFEIEKEDEEEHVHTLVTIEQKQPTCTEDGNIQYYMCSTCKKLYSDNEGTNEINKEDTILSAIGHDWGEWQVIKEPSVDEEGVKTRICKNDQSHEESENIAKLPYTVISGNNQVIDNQDTKELTIKMGVL